MKVYIGTDHRGVETQNKIVNYLKDLGIDINISKLKHNDNDDYPDFAFDVCKRVVDNKKYPAWFEYLGKKYRLEIYEE